MREVDHKQLLERIRGAEPTAWAEALEELEPYLRVMAQRRLGQGLRPRVDPADVVQEACLEAHRDSADLRAQTWPEFVAWLLKIVEHRALASVREHQGAEKRSVGRERGRENSSTGHPGLEAASEITSPSQRAMRGENAVRLAAALVQLSGDQYEAVRLRHLEGCSLAEIADRLGRSQVATASLLKRGLQALRRLLVDPSATPDAGSRRSTG